MSAQVIGPRAVTNVGDASPLFRTRKELVMINMCCENCLHADLLGSELPCRDCLRTLDTSSYWESCNDYDEKEPYRCCTNCKHVLLLPLDEPCATCIDRKEYYSEWEQREIVKEDVLPFQEPCHTCLKKGAHDGKKAKDN